MGGLVGSSTRRIIASYSQAEVVGVDVVDGARIGGLVGLNSSADIKACYATGDVTSTSTTEFARGGLVGVNADGALIEACYSTGRVTDSGTGDKGGLVGTNVGGDPGVVRNSYFDSVTAGLSEAIGNDEGTTTNVSDQTTAELQSLTDYSGIFADWNIDIDGDSDGSGATDDPLDPGLEDGSAAGDAGTDSPWDFGGNANYPRLSIDFDLDGDASVDEFGEQVRTAPTTTPSAPASLTPNVVSDTQIDLVWTAPASNGGSVITGYKVEFSTDGGISYTAAPGYDYDGSFLYAHIGLTAGTTYHYQVAAINSVGTGVYATTSATTTGGTSGSSVPAAPASLTANVVSDHADRPRLDSARKQRRLGYYGLSASGL